ncbi:hypothetical protein BAY59_27865 [Prauserella coralliicola]|nr:hypothetical protein BAY59_27865 [Prauserella coralliicola]
MSTADWEYLPWARVRQRHEDLLGPQLDHVLAHSAFYRRKLGEAGIGRADLTGLDALEAVPFTTKAELRRSLADQPPLGAHLAVRPSEIVQVHATSGTTGAPVYLALTAGDRDVWNEMGARVFRTNGIRRGEVVLQAFAMSRGFVGGLPIVQQLQHVGCTVLPIGAEAGTERLLLAIDQLRPTALVGTPSLARHLAESAPAVLGKPATALPIRLLSLGGEPGAGIPSVRQRLRELWNAEVRDLMGGADFGSTYWAECDAGGGMHLCSQNALHVELVDPATGRAQRIEQGSRGELVYTALRRHASPLLRYRSGDLVEVAGTECPCGRTGFRIVVLGRADDMLIVRGINVFPAAVKDVVGGLLPRVTGAVRIIAGFPGHTTDQPLPVRVEHAEGLPSPQHAALTREIADRLHRRLGVRAEVRLVPPGSLRPLDGHKEILLERTTTGS